MQVQDASPGRRNVFIAPAVVLGLYAELCAMQNLQVVKAQRKDREEQDNKALQKDKARFGRLVFLLLLSDQRAGSGCV